MAKGLSVERIEKILLHDNCNEIFLNTYIILKISPWCSGQCSSWRPAFNFLAKQIFKLTFFFILLLLLLLQSPNLLIILATFKITQILSPERASERKVMSTVEQFIWVNLYSLDLRFAESSQKSGYCLILTQDSNLSQVSESTS